MLKASQYTRIRKGIESIEEDLKHARKIGLQMQDTFCVRLDLADVASKSKKLAEVVARIEEENRREEESRGQDVHPTMGLFPELSDDRRH